jgi:hypothetical protein
MMMLVMRMWLRSLGRRDVCLWNFGMGGVEPCIGAGMEKGCLSYAVLSVCS